MRADVYRRLFRIASRVGRPGAVLSVGDSAGALLYLEAAQHPVSVVVALDRADVVELVVGLGAWLEEQTCQARDHLREPAPLVAGSIDRGRKEARTVQLRTVPPS